MSNSNQLINQNLEKIRHSAEHVLTYAMLTTYGPDKIVMAHGPAIENGFYFDFDKPADFSVSDKDFPKIEKAMAKIIKANWTFKKLQVSAGLAAKFFHDNEYKLETIHRLTDESLENPAALVFYSLAPAEKNEALTIEKLETMDFAAALQAGYFIDLCKGPHVEKTGEIKAFKLLRLSSAYWMADENNKMLTRLYGTAFASQADLDEYIHFLEEAKKRDHKRIGKQQDLFSFHPNAPGCVFWHAKGMIIWDILEDFGQSIRRKYGYTKIKTPEMAKSTLWKTSGHWDHYKDDMFVFDDEGETFCLKPMDCPFNIYIYQTRQRSYRDLPIRYTEIGHIFRHEQSGELNGLFRLREFTQDDSHLLIREDQIAQEVGNLIAMVKEFYVKLGVTPEYFLSTRPDDFMGEIETWNRAEADLIEILTSNGIKYGLKEKDGAFYGPKIDVNIKDSLGRSWQVATIQLDFQLPGRFGTTYVDRDGSEKTPVMIHAAVFGSFERMIGILLEHFAGRLPLWLAPVQVKLLPIADRHVERADEIKAALEKAGVRVEIDDRSERLPAKIRDAQVEQVPMMVVIGDAEVNSDKLSVRYREDEKADETLSVEELVAKIAAETK
ncbi:threonine--tRNA ligase [bacterium]|nr:threonine--tRNA ligase [bacterium]